MKTRGLLTLGATLAGLALAVVALQLLLYRGGLPSDRTDSRTAIAPALASAASQVIRHASATDRRATTMSRTSVASVATGAAGASEAAEPDESIPAPGASVATPAPGAAASVAPARTLDLEPTGGEASGPSITIKKDAVIGVRLDRAITTETARVDDRVSARVARDVLVDDRPALAAGTCVEGHVAVLERGSRSSDYIRIGIQFTSIVLADNRRIPLQVDTVFRESDPPVDADATNGRSALNAFLAGGITRPGPARAQPVPPGFRRDVRIPAGSLLTMKLTAPLVIEQLVIER